MNAQFLKGAAIVLALAMGSGAASAQIKLGVAGPITGANASFGAQLTNGVQQAAKDINAAGGILGRQIDVQHQDNQSQAQIAKAVRMTLRNSLMLPGHW